jgi:hypothetical protein
VPHGLAASVELLLASRRDARHYSVGGALPFGLQLSWVGEPRGHELQPVERSVDGLASVELRLVSRRDPQKTG